MPVPLEKGVLKETLEEWENKQKRIRAKMRYEFELDKWKIIRMKNGFKSFLFTAGLVLSVWGLAELAAWFRQWFLATYTEEQRIIISMVIVGIVIFIGIWSLAWSFINPPVPEDYSERGDNALKGYLHGLKSDD